MSQVTYFGCSGLKRNSEPAGGSLGFLSAPWVLVSVSRPSGTARRKSRRMPGFLLKAGYPLGTTSSVYPGTGSSAPASTRVVPFPCGNWYRQRSSGKKKDTQQRHRLNKIAGGSCPETREMV